MSLPFGTFERVLVLPDNAAAAAEFSTLAAQLEAEGKGSGGGGGVPGALAKLRALVGSKLAPPAALVQVRRLPSVV